jgi:hypothetical protein
MICWDFSSSIFILLGHILSTGVVAPNSVKDEPLPILAAPESKIFGTTRAGHGKASKPSG